MSNLWRYSPERCDGDFCPGNCDHCSCSEEDEDEMPEVRDGSDKSDGQPAAAGRRRNLPAAGMPGLWIQIHNA